MKSNAVSLSAFCFTQIWQPKVNEVKNVLPFQKYMKHPQTKFNVDTMSHSKVIRSKIRSKFIVRSFSCSRVFFSLSIFYWSYNNRFWYVFASL